MRSCGEQKIQKRDLVVNEDHFKVAMVRLQQEARKRTANSSTKNDDAAANGIKKKDVDNLVG